VLDYQGWLRDRGRMFKKPMKVAATTSQIARTAPASGLLRATFVQAFSSGTYADRGRKQIDVAAIGGALVIAREELLESERLPAKTRPRASAGTAPTRAAAPAPCPPAKAEPFSGTFRGSLAGWSSAKARPTLRRSWRAR
jgi:hypothetical protein